MPEHSSGTRRPSAQNIQLILLGLGLVALLSLAALLFFRMGSIDQRLGDMSKEWQSVAGKIDESDRRSEEALSLARQAEKNAAIAARERDEADYRRQLAEEKSERVQEQADEVQGEIDRMKQEQEERLRDLELDLSKIAETRRTALGVVLNLGSDVMKFDFNKSSLKWEHKELLSRIVGILLTQEGYGIYVYGHTDDVGSGEYNLELSKKRADAVRDYLVEAGINPEIITTDGFGKQRPLVEGTSSEDRAKNRRVEIGVINTRINYQRSIP